MISAFAGGVAMFLAPCTLPIVPAFLASMVPDEKCLNHQREIFIRTVLFTVGFSVVFVVLGMLSGYFGATLTVYKSILAQIGSMFIIAFGLMLIGVFQIPVLRNAFQRIRVPKMKKGRVIRPIVLGVVFALGWSPCAGPLLASILLLASQTGTVVEGGVLLMIFSLGLAVPFILTGALFAQSTHFFASYAKYQKHISIVSGVFLIVLGFSLLFSQTLLFSDVGFALYDFFGVVPMCYYY
jgi:cytochrome c-type biogenesis protein